MEKAKTLDKSPRGSNSRHSLYVIAFITSTWLEFKSSEFARTRVAHTRDVLCGYVRTYITPEYMCASRATRRPWKPIMKYLWRVVNFRQTHANYLQIVWPTRVSRIAAQRDHGLSSMFASNLSFSFVPPDAAKRP